MSQLWNYGTYHTGDQQRPRRAWVSPEPSLFAHMKYGNRRRIRPKIRHLRPLNGYTCTFEDLVYGGRIEPFLMTWLNLKPSSMIMQLLSSEISQMLMVIILWPRGWERAILRTKGVGEWANINRWVISTDLTFYQWWYPVQSISDGSRRVKALWNAQSPPVGVKSTTLLI